MKRIITKFRLVCLCMVGLLMGHALNAQIIYQDIDPDLNGAELQQNVSGIVFQFAGGGSFTPNSNVIDALAMISGNADDIAILSPGDMIGPNGFWNMDAWINATGTVTYTDKYIGFRLPVTGGYQYGWFKIDVTYTNPGAGATWTVKSYAYQQTPNIAIVAGDQGDGGGGNGGGSDGGILVTSISVSGLYGVSSITSNGGTLQMTATVMPADAYNNDVFWSVENGTGAASISTTGLLTAISDGTVIVKAHAMDGSGVTGQATINIFGQTTAVSDLNTLQSLCYPNPVENELCLRFDKNETIHAISIYNLTGQQVYDNRREQTNNLIKISTETLPAGVYTLTFENSDGKKGTQKFVKQ